MQIIPSKDVPPPRPISETFKGSAHKAAEADIIIAVRGDSIGIIKSRFPLMVTYHERDANGDLVFSLRYR